MRFRPPRNSNMFKNYPTKPGCLLFLLLMLSIFLAMAQKKTTPVNVGVILESDTWFGKMGLSCINMALSDFYAVHAYYNTRMVLHTRDSRKEIVVAAGAALDLINNVEVQAIVGPESSMKAKFVTDLGDKAQVPIISFSATSPSLRSSYFFRIAQSDSSQVKAISSIIQAFGWNEAVPISVDDEFGEGMIPYLTTALRAVGAGIPYWSIIPPMATNDQIGAELYKLMTMQIRVFIVHMAPSLGSRLFAKAKELGMMSEGYVWIMTNGMTNYFSSLNSSVVDTMQGVLGLKTYVPVTEELENFRVRWQRKFQQENPNLLNVKLDVFGLWAHDAAWALAMAIEKVGSTNFSFQNMNISGSSRDIERLGVSQSGPELVGELSGTKFRGLSGDFSLINGQLQSSIFQVVNVNDGGERGIGYWTPRNGLVRNLSSKNKSRYSASNVSLGPIIWPGETTSAPKGWQIPMRGRKLRILVPVKHGFKEFVNVTHDPTMNRINVSGYCIDVFHAVIEALPYDVPYEFFASAKPESYDDLVNQVFLGNYDAAVGDITIRANRSLYVDFTLPYTESGISMVVPIKDNNNSKNTWMFFKPLTWDLWAAFGCFFIFIGFVVWVLEHRINKDFQGSPNQQISTSFWFGLSTMVFAHREQVVSSLARFVVIVWCFVVLIMTQSYAASLATFLTVQQLQPTVTDVNLLIKSGDSVGYPTGSSLYGALKQLGFQDENLKTYNSAEELDELFQNGNHGISAAFDESPYMRLFVAAYCSNYTMIDPNFKADGFAFVFQKGSLLTREFSRAITLVQEGVAMRHIDNKWFRKKASCSNPRTAGSSSSVTLSLDSFWGLFLIAGVASSLALLIFAAMFLYEHRYTLRCIDPEISFWRRILVILRVCDRSKTYKGSRLHGQDSVQGIGAVESSPNISSPESTSCDSSDIESQIVLTDTEHGDLNPNSQATQEVEYAIELTSPSQDRPITP